MIKLLKMFWHNTPRKWPNEWGRNWTRKKIDSVSNQQKKEIRGVLDIHEMKNNAVKIDLAGGTDFNRAVNLLLKKM